MNSTDLHIKYHMETGEWHQWGPRSTGQFHDTDHYSREYATWLEENYLKLLNEKIENIGLLEHVEKELEDATEYVNSLEEEIEDLNDYINELENRE
jgi:type IV secretory pathway VirB4 component